MENLKIRRAKECDIPIIDKLLYEVHKVHSDVRPDLFKAGAKKYSEMFSHDIHPHIFLSMQTEYNIKQLYLSPSKNKLHQTAFQLNRSMKLAFPIHMRILLSALFQ